VFFQAEHHRALKSTLKMQKINFLIHVLLCCYKKVVVKVSLAKYVYELFGSYIAVFKKCIFNIINVRVGY